MRPCLAVFSACAALCIVITTLRAGDSNPDPSLKIVIIRHAEKQEPGHNLSCAGMNRALQLPKVLHKKFGKPHHIYVPSIKCGKTTSHVRMFQTVSPLASKYNLEVNTSIEEKATSDLSDHVRKKSGTVFIVWEHSVIEEIAKKLGVKSKDVPKWKETDFDAIWIVTFADGEPKLSMDVQEINPSDDCDF